MTAARKTYPARARQNRRQAELRQLAALMRERAGLAPAPVVVPLHRMAQQRAKQADASR